MFILIFEIELRGTGKLNDWTVYTGGSENES